jgi:hypothetical protein
VNLNNALVPVVLKTEADSGLKGRDGEIMQHSTSPFTG